MRYAIFTDIHANLEALEAVLAKIDEIAKEKPIDQVWFLGDLVGYGPDPNECVTRLRERTNVIIAGNHDWAAVGKIDLEDFSAAARISAEWTAEQLTEEHRNFLADLPERIEIDDCTLVHGSPYGPLWEYLTSEVLAERSFQYFKSRFCFVGHTHVPVIFQQPDTIANAPTLPLANSAQNGQAVEATVLDHGDEEAEEAHSDEVEMVVVHPSTYAASTSTAHAESAYADPETNQAVSEESANAVLEAHMLSTELNQAQETTFMPEDETNHIAETTQADGLEQSKQPADKVQSEPEETHVDEAEEAKTAEAVSDKEDITTAESIDDLKENDATPDDTTPEEIIVDAEDRLNSEIEELLTLLGLSESMIQVTNEMQTPPEGHWEPEEAHRAIINPGGVGQPRDGDPRAAFMIYDTETGFEFYRIPYPFNLTQEKIIKAGLPQYLAVRLAYGR